MIEMKTYQWPILALTAVIFSSPAISAQASVAVIGGKLVTRDDSIASSTVALMMKHKKGPVLCTGVLVDSKHVLTAGDCMNGISGGDVVFSTGDATTAVEKTPNLTRKFTSIKVMPGYSGQTGGSTEFSDFAIVTFEGDVPTGYAPAKFLPASFMQSRLKSGASLSVAGYGIDTYRQDFYSGWNGAGTLRKVGVKLMQIGKQGIDMYLLGTPAHIECDGDGGGPATLSLKNGTNYVVGIGSRGNCEDEAIYTIVNKEMVTSFVESVSNH
jgi:secreted trypsin-like serine protease